MPTTVGQLIQQLNKFDKEAVVLMKSHDNEFDGHLFSVREMDLEECAFEDDREELEKILEHTGAPTLVALST